MDALQSKVDTIGGEVSQISDVLREYLDQGVPLPSGRKVQPPKTKASRDLLQQLLGRLDQVSTELGDVRKLSTPPPKSSSSSYFLPIAPSTDAQPLPPPSSSSPSPIGTLVSPSTHANPGPPETPRHHVDDSTDGQLTAPLPPTDLKTGLPISVSASSQTPSTRAAPTARPLTAGRLTSRPALPPALPTKTASHASESQLPQGITLSDGSVYRSPLACEHASPLFDCVYRDINVLNEELFELYSSHPVVRDVGYFKLQVRDLPPLNVQEVARPSKDHATSFSYKIDKHGIVRVDSGKRFKFSSPNLPFPSSTKLEWSLEEQKELWNSSAANPPKGMRPYIIGNPLFEDVELSPGEKLRRRGRTTLEGINTQYVYFNLTGKTITTMHREDAHVRSENLLRSGQHKFWCFIKPAFGKKLEERMAIEYPEMRRCSQALRHLSRHIPPAKLDEWGIEYTLDYCVPGQAVVTEPATYHQVLNLGPNYAIAINLEYNSSPDMPPDYRFCDRNCPDKFAMSADDFRIYEKQPEQQFPRTPETAGQDGPAAPASEQVTRLQQESTISRSAQSVTPPPEHGTAKKLEPSSTQPTSGATEGQGRFRALGDEQKTGAPQPSTFPQLASSMPSPEQSVSPASNPTEPLDPVPKLLENKTGHISPVPTQVHTPTTFANSAQVVPPVPPTFTHDANQRGYINTQALQPLRKTARMINPDRTCDTQSPRPPKKQRTQPPSTPITPLQPTGGAFQHLSTILKAHQTTTRNGSAEAEKLSGKPAFERLSGLVREWRRFSRSASAILGRFGLIVTIEEAAHGYPELHTFLLRFLKMKMAICVESALAWPGQVVPPNFMDGMLNTLGWDEAKRPQLHDYLREGKCWAALCGKYDGLLCLVAPDADCSELALFKEELAHFHAALDTEFVRNMCNVGAALQKSIWECLELPEFIWESTPTTSLAVDQISPMLAPFRLLKSNYYDSSNGMSWPRPASWRWEWPADPTVVHPGSEKACSFCPSKTCRCVEIKVPQIPRISDDGSKGSGVRSMGPHRANDILGELVGELLPPGSCIGGWSMALHRPDLDDETVADIYPARMGNWVRKVNHSANPSTMFRVMKISGRWRLMLVAVRDIGDGEEITAKYGNGFLKDQPYSFVEGLH
ncbi:hypothetical protein B0J18DRAFT_420314 [Chaetomium sp. MPI-SDFR-AT-0129]|nr:hypothetical protein B0J18DRAFT_420314 [Chaetomium sp. MPI-SDFR-AT-0129]